MKTLSLQTAARFAGAATTRATCWRITRRDGKVFGFTDHDREIAFDGATFRPDLGFETTASTLEPDFASGSAEVAGILSSPEEEKGVAAEQVVHGVLHVRRHVGTIT